MIFVQFSFLQKIKRSTNEFSPSNYTWIYEYNEFEPIATRDHHSKQFFPIFFTRKSRDACRIITLLIVLRGKHGGFRSTERCAADEIVTAWAAGFLIVVSPRPSVCLNFTRLGMKEVSGDLVGKNAREWHRSVD